MRKLMAKGLQWEQENSKLKYHKIITEVMTQIKTKTSNNQTITKKKITFQKADDKSTLKI